MTRKVVFLLMAVLALGACGSAVSGDAGTSPEDPVSAPAQPAPGGGSGPELREPEEGLVDVRARPFDRHRARGRDVSLLYHSGLGECYGLDRVDVVERERKVVLTIFEGRHPEAQVCAEIAVEARSIVTLESPLGDRKLVDGSR